MTSTDAGALGRVEHAERREHVVVVVEGLALAHHDDARGSGLEVVGDVRDLVEHLRSRKRAREAAHARGAKDATHAASGLRGDADGEAVARRHANALRAGAVGELYEVLATAVSRDLSGDLVGATERAARRKLLSELGRNVAHLVKGCDVMLPNPILDLLGPEGGPPKLGHECEKLLVGKRAQVKRGRGRLGIMRCHAAAFLA